MALSEMIVYSRKEELLPLIRSHYRYNLQLGQRTAMDYDLKSLQRHLQTWLLAGKPLIRTRPLVTKHRYPEECTTASMLHKLRENLTQKPLPEGLARTVEAQCNVIGDVTQCLSLLDVCIGFLSIVQRAPDMSLADFIRDDLLVKDELVLMSELQQCCVEHSESLWLLLTRLKASFRASLDMDPFDTLIKQLPLSTQLEESVLRLLAHCTSEDLQALQALLVSFGVMRCSMDADLALLQIPLREHLPAHAEEEELPCPDQVKELRLDLLPAHLAQLFAMSVNLSN